MRTTKQQMNTKEVAQALRAELKAKFPGYVFSVVKDDVNHITLTLMKAPIFPFKDPNTTYKQVNQFHIKSSPELTTEAQEVMQAAYELTLAYNFDDSDLMTDYFCVNFYLALGIGKWDKPFEVLC